MPGVYFETHFRVEDFIDDWPIEFAIITAFSPTGEKWSAEQCQAADEELESYLRQRGQWLKRLTGFSPVTGHAEPSWATVLSLDDACDLGLRFHQDAIYYAEGDLIFVTYCDQRRQLVPVGGFRERLSEKQ